MEHNGLEKIGYCRLTANENKNYFYAFITFSSNIINDFDKDLFTLTITAIKSELKGFFIKNNVREITISENGAKLNFENAKGKLFNLIFLQVELPEQYDKTILEIEK
jgi:hypothetical protein